MADKRDAPQTGAWWEYPKKLPMKDQAVSPPWFSGGGVFSYGVDPLLAEPLNELPLAYKFSSPFVDGSAVDSYFLRTVSKGDFRASPVSRDLRELAAKPPNPFWQPQIPHRTSPPMRYMIKRDFGFCLYFYRHWESIADYDNVYNHTHFHKVEVASGGKILTKQDVMLQAYGVTNGSTPTYGLISIHEADATTLTDVESYNLSRPRIVAMCSDVVASSNASKVPNGVSYVLTTDPAAQPDVTPEGVYWMTFPDTTYSYQSSPVDVPKFKYLTSGGWVQTLVFVGDFSLKALHDYLCNTNGILAPYDPASDPSNFGGRNHDYLAASVANELYPDVYNPTVFQPLGAATKRRSNPDLGIPLAGTLLLDPTMEGLAEYRETWLSKVSHCDNVYVSGGYPSKFIGSGMPVTEIKNAAFYKEGSYYHQYNIFLSNEGARIAQRLDSSTGLYTTPFYGNAKIEAYTFNGSAPTGYKPVYLIERATGQMIRETVSDKNGKYVLHGIPQGVEYVALSVDPKKTYNSVVEEFGVVE